MPNAKPEHGLVFETASGQADAAAVDLMKERGLTVVESTDEGEWRRELSRFADAMRGRMVPEDAYDRIFAARDEVRQAIGERAGRGSP